MKGKPWTDKEFDFLEENYSRMSNKEIAKQLNRPVDSIPVQAYKLGLKKDFGSVLFAVYKGDDLLGVGTRDELIKGLGISKHRLYNLAKPSYHKEVKEGGNAMIAYRLDDLEEMA